VSQSSPFRQSAHLHHREKRIPLASHLLDGYNEKHGEEETTSWQTNSNLSFCNEGVVFGIAGENSIQKLKLTSAEPTSGKPTSAEHYSRTFKLNMNGDREKGVEGGIWPKMLIDAGRNADRETWMCSRC
jgi:hypothetical protein